MLDKAETARLEVEAVIYPPCSELEVVEVALVVKLGNDLLDALLLLLDELWLVGWVKLGPVRVLVDEPLLKILTHLRFGSRAAREVVERPGVSSLKVVCLRKCGKLFGGDLLTNFESMLPNNV